MDHDLLRKWMGPFWRRGMPVKMVNKAVLRKELSLTSS